MTTIEEIKKLFRENVLISDEEISKIKNLNCSKFYHLNVCKYLVTTRTWDYEARANREDVYPAVIVSEDFYGENIPTYVIGHKIDKLTRYI